VRLGAGATDQLRGVGFSENNRRPSPVSLIGKRRFSDVDAERARLRHHCPLHGASADASVLPIFNMLLVCRGAL
jgi:hypothetical protein